VAGNVQRQVRAAGLRVQIVQMSREGMSNEDIARDLSITSKTVSRHMRKFLETDSKYPVNLGPEVVDLMRSEDLDQTQNNQRRILQQMEQLQSLEPEDISERVAVSTAICKCNDSYIRASEHIANMFGLIAPKPELRVTNNNSLTITGGDEIQYLRDLARLKELQRNGQSRLPAIQPDTAL
jgi:hypothetical protein